MSDSEDKTPAVHSEELYIINERLKLLSEKLDRVNEKSGADEKWKSKPWWSTLVEILGIPALVVAILLQVSQISASKGAPEKTFAETENLKMRTLKARAELEGILDNLADKKQMGVAAYRAQIDETLPRLESTLQRLRDIEQKSHESTTQRLLVISIAMWVVYSALNLFFEILGHIWSTILNSLTNTVYALKDFDPDKPKNREKEKRIRRLQRLMPWAHSLLGPLPGIVHWAIRVSIFIAIMVPFFDQISGLIGSNQTFELLTMHAKQGNVAVVIERLREMLLAGASNIALQRSA